MDDGSPSELMAQGWVPPPDPPEDEPLVEDDEYEEIDEGEAEPDEGEGPPAQVFVPPPPPVPVRKRRQAREPGEPIVIEADREKHKIRMRRYHLRKKLRADRVPEHEIDRRLALAGLAPETMRDDDEPVH